MRKKPDAEKPAGTEIAEPGEYADSDLVRKSLQGDLESFELLIERYQQAVYNIAYYKSRNYFDAEDLAQDIFLAAFKALPQIEKYLGGELAALPINNKMACFGARTDGSAW